MKKRQRKRTVQKTTPRNTQSKKIAALAKKDPIAALNFASYGEQSSAVYKLHTEHRMDGKTDSDFIQTLLALDGFANDQKLKADKATCETVAWKRAEIEKRFTVYHAPIFFERIAAGDSAFFRDFANKLDSEKATRKAAMLEEVDRDAAEFQLLARKAWSDEPVNLSEMAREIVDKSFATAPMPKDRDARAKVERTKEKRMASTRRNLTRLAKRLGVKTMGAGRPPN